MGIMPQSMPFPVPVFLKITKTLHLAAFRTKRHPSKSGALTLQHLLVVEDGAGPDVIKHRAQIWKYEDPRILTYEGGNTWLPVSHSPEETEAASLTKVIPTKPKTPRQTP